MSSVEPIIVKDQSAADLADEIETALQAGGQGVVMRPTHWRKVRRFAQLCHELTGRRVAWVEVRTTDGVQLWCWDPDPSNLRTVPVFAAIGDNLPTPAGEGTETGMLLRDGETRKVVAYSDEDYPEKHFMEGAC